MNLRNRARSLFKRDSLSEHAVNASKIDHAVLRDLRRRAPKVDEAISSPPRLKNGTVVDGKVWERLSEDLWSEFYGEREPELRSRDRIEQRFRINRELADKHARDDSFAKMRPKTRGELVPSAVGLLGALDSFGRSYGDELSDYAEREGEIIQHEDRVDSIDDRLEELRQLRNELHADPDAIDEEIRSLATEKRGAVDEIKALKLAQAQHGGDLLDAARAAASQAAESAEEAVEAASLMPGMHAGAGSRVSPELAIAFAERVEGSRVLRNVLDMLGRLEISMGTVRRQFRKGGYEEIVDIELGNDLNVVLPHEKALLTHPVARMDFYRRFHERSLMQYDVWSEEELKKGPVIIGADGSDSMRGVANEFCRGLTLATCSIGNREGRNTAALEFGSTGELREFWFPGNRPLDTETALDFAEHFFAGGTDINQVLLRAHDLIRDEAPFHSADLLIITDGGDRLTESTYVLRDRLREMGVKIHGICVGVHPTQYMVEVCDHVSSLFDFTGPNPVSDRIAIDLT